MDPEELLARVPLFRNLPAEQLQELGASMVRQAFESGATIFSHGDVPKYFYIVEDGVVDILVPTLGDEVIVATFETNSFFGELGLFDRQPRTATARASVPTNLACIPLEAVASLIDAHPHAAKQFMSVIIGRLRAADEMLSRLRLRNVNEIADEKMTFGERIADMVAQFGGSWTFIISFLVFLLAWMAVNTLWLAAEAPASDLAGLDSASSYEYDFRAPGPCGQPMRTLSAKEGVEPSRTRRMTRSLP